MHFVSAFVRIKLPLGCYYSKITVKGQTTIKQKNFERFKFLAIFDKTGQSVYSLLRLVVFSLLSYRSRKSHFNVTLLANQQSGRGTGSEEINIFWSFFGLSSPYESTYLLEWTFTINSIFLFLTFEMSFM